MPGSDLLLVDSGTSAESTLREVAASDGAVDVADLYDLTHLDLSPYRGLVLTSGADQVFLHRHRGVVGDVLGRGGVVVFSGQICRPWLPGASPFVPRLIRSHRDYEVRLPTPHPIFEGVQPDDLTFRRGVAGFFSRGHHPAPPEAIVLATLPGGEPAVYVDHHSTAGTILLHAGGDLLGYTSTDSTASRLPPQLLDWMRSEGRR